MASSREVVEVQALVIGMDAPRRGVVEHLLQRHVRHRRDQLEQRRRGRAAARPQRRAPRRCPSLATRTAMPGAPWCCSGTNGSGGADSAGDQRAHGVAGAGTGAPGRRPAARRRPPVARRSSPGGPAGRPRGAANTNSVTTPKLVPAPRSAQNRSGSWSSAARDDAAVRGDQRGGDQVVAAQALLGRQPAHAAAEGQPGDAGVADRPADHRQTVRGRRCVDRLPSVLPRRRRRAGPRHRPGRAFIRDRSIITAPSSTALPAALCPPPRTVRSTPRDRRTATAEATSSTEDGRTIAAGVRRMSPFQIASARATSKPSSSGVSTSPATLLRRSVMARSVVMSPPRNRAAPAVPAGRCGAGQPRTLARPRQAR